MGMSRRPCYRLEDERIARQDLEQVAVQSPSQRAPACLAAQDAGGAQACQRAREDDRLAQPQIDAKTARSKEENLNWMKKMPLIKTDAIERLIRRSRLQKKHESHGRHDGLRRRRQGDTAALKEGATARQVERGPWQKGPTQRSRTATEQSDHKVEERKGGGKAPCQLQRALKRRND